jgi:hypothetical protein
VYDHGCEDDEKQYVAGSPYAGCRLAFVMAGHVRRHLEILITRYAAPAGA